MLEKILSLIEVILVLFVFYILFLLFTGAELSVGKEILFSFLRF